MKTYNNYIKESNDNIEKIFIQLSHIDELVIEFNFFGNLTDIYYCYYNSVNISKLRNRRIIHFIYNKKSEYMWINNDIINSHTWKTINDIDVIKNIVEKLWNIHNITIKILWN